MSSFSVAPEVVRGRAGILPGGELKCDQGLHAIRANVYFWYLFVYGREKVIHRFDFQVDVHLLIGEYWVSARTTNSRSMSASEMTLR